MRLSPTAATLTVTNSGSGFVVAVSAEETVPVSEGASNVVASEKASDVDTAYSSGIS